ncbi:hypothetical protein [uncultured Parasphingorhabdus sp.]|uniref:hypothetical protein n=1 Tax=uncultured Parasphingorhabdus sp. TaxID=2709694 RepID=UPI0030DC6C8E|tara:strand:+ start:42285 stop:42533 length:249 start_codon:yes stop_codon:yes gene_type:complete
MAWNFDGDYLSDLEPVLSQLSRLNLKAAIRSLEETKAAGSTGGEILDGIRRELKNLDPVMLDEPAKMAVVDYLERSSRGLFS